jgi:hypothetical protein
MSPLSGDTGDLYFPPATPIYSSAPNGRALAPKYVATGRHPPYNTPARTPAAFLPMAMELEPPPSTSIPSLAPELGKFLQHQTWREIFADGQKQKPVRLIDPHRGSGIRMTIAPRPNRVIMQPNCLPADTPFRLCELEGGFDGRRCGLNFSSNQSKYVCSQT